MTPNPRPLYPRPQRPLVWRAWAVWKQPDPDGDIPKSLKVYAATTRGRAIECARHEWGDKYPAPFTWWRARRCPAGDAEAAMSKKRQAIGYFAEGEYRSNGRVKGVNCQN